MNMIKELRARKRINQQELGEIVGETQQVISHWETGRTNPKPHQMQALEDYFGVPKEQIFSALFNYKNE